MVIADEWQERGLGTTLLSMLVSRATGRGVRLVLDVLPANDRRVGSIGCRLPEALVERTRDSIVIRPQIGPAGVADIVALPALIALPRAATYVGGTRAPDRSAA